MDEVSIQDWLTNLKSIFKDYDANKIFNADETGLYSMIMRNKTFALNSVKCAGKESVKQRETILSCIVNDEEESY